MRGGDRGGGGGGGRFAGSRKVRAFGLEVKGLGLRV